jgi:ABC-type lipoprotein export system ATPase subunit
MEPTRSSSSGGEDVSDDLIWARPEDRPKESEQYGGTDGPKQSVLSTSGVIRTFRRGSEQVTALNGVDFELMRGELVALVGRSGSGKTTLLNVLCGWEVPDSGIVKWKDSPSPLASIGWEGIALVPQSPGLLGDLSVAENVGLPCRLKGELGPTTHLAIAELFEVLGLSQLADRYPSEMSLGEQQRTSVARALIVNPEVLLADEPTAHQDEASMTRVLDAIRAVVASGRSCLVASHSAEVLRRADRVVEMTDGRLVAHEV